MSIVCISNIISLFIMDITTRSSIRVKPLFLGADIVQLNNNTIMKKYILGIKIDDISVDQVVTTVEKWLSVSQGRILRGQKHYIVTPNPEIVVMAQKDKELKNIINNTDLAIPDGTGLKLATDIENTTPGIDVVERLVKMAADLGFTTGFLGGRDKVALKCAECLKKKYPKLKVSFAESGGEISKEGDGGGWGNLGDLGKVDLLFVAFGPPKQEKWIAKNLRKLDVRVAMGVGGAFDYISGRVPRAPIWIRNLGFEWLFRLIIQPWRIKRQLALVKYLWLLISQH